MAVEPKLSDQEIAGPTELAHPSMGIGASIARKGAVVNTTWML